MVIKNLIMAKIWQDVHIQEYRHLYKVSTTGEMWSNIRNSQLRLHIRSGYPSVCLYNGKLKSKKTVNVHDLVANAFLVPLEGGIVNHKNGLKNDNRVENLEWTTYQGNTAHALNTGLATGHPKSVAQYDLNGNLIAIYPSINEASRATGANAKHIPSACRGTDNRQTCGGFIWRYTNPNDQPNNDNEPKQDIQDYPNYSVTRSGKIFSKRIRSYLKPHKMPSEYLSVKLCNEIGSKDFYIHDLVATAYIQNHDNKPHVNHKNGDKEDNRVENLEWVTQSENMIHAHRVIKFAYTTPVIQMSLSGEVIKRYESIRSANLETKVDSSSIVRVCKGKSSYAGGFLWKYEVTDPISTQSPMPISC
jgi:hypothetical protein